MRSEDGRALERALVELGLPPEEAAAAVAEDRVALAVVARMARRTGPYTLDELAERSGVPVWVLRERFRALGVSEHARFGDDDVAEARLLARMRTVVPDSALVRVLRADAQALTRVALTHLEVAHDHFVIPVRREGGDDVAVALSLAEAHASLREVAGELVERSYHHLVDQLLSSELVAAATREEREQVVLAIGFADVVGYTSLSARIDPGGLEEVIEAFESRCYAVAGLAPLVQLVKFLGDAAMFVSTDPQALAGALLDTVATPEDDSPLAGTPIRAALACGPVTMRGGDYYGPTVNLAARLVDRTRAGRVLAEESLADELSGAFSLHRLPPMSLRGLRRHRPLVVRGRR